MKLLTILIPTYNRSNKLLRLLNQIYFYLNKDEKYSRIIDVIISDNGSIDNTKDDVTSFIKFKNNFKYFRQSENKGFDNNIKLLYDYADSEFVWYFSDDDILFEVAFDKIINSLTRKKPDILLFSFAQPHTNKELTFNFPSSSFDVIKVSEIIELIALYPKVSIYVLKKISIPLEDQNYLDTIIGKGFYFLSLSYSIISLSKKPKMTIISEQLASCDDEFTNFSIPPDIFLYFYETFKHPYVLKMSPELYLKKKDDSYTNTLGYLFKIKEGKFKVDDIEEYDAYITKFQFNGSILIKEIPLLFQFFLLKTNGVFFYCKYLKPIYDRIIKPIRKSIF